MPTDLRQTSDEGGARGGEARNGKTKALFDRPAVRDLYDVYRIQKDGLPVSLAADDDELNRLQRRVRIYYASLSMPFPCPIDGRAFEEFASRASEEQEYLRRLEESSEYVPRLLFAQWSAVQARAEESPAAEWGVMNLRKWPAEPEGDCPEW